MGGFLVLLLLRSQLGLVLRSSLGVGSSLRLLFGVASLLLLMADHYGDDLTDAAVDAIEQGRPFLSMPAILEAAAARNGAIAGAAHALFGAPGSHERAAFEARCAKITPFHINTDGMALPPAADGTALGFDAYLLPDHTAGVVLGGGAAVSPVGHARWTRFWGAQAVGDTFWPLVAQFHALYRRCGAPANRGALQLYAALEGSPRG